MVVYNVVSNEPPPDNHDQPNSQAPELFARFYEDLRRLAHARLRHNEPITLLNTTSLVHETFLRVLHSGQIDVAERPRFLAYAARVMRSVIVDSVRQRNAERRGGDALHVPLDSMADPDSGEEEVLRLSEALDDLAQVDPRLVKIVEMRYFAGLTEADIAAALGIHERTVRRDWHKARLLLSVALRSSE